MGEEFRISHDVCILLFSEAEKKKIQTCYSLNVLFFEKLRKKIFCFILEISNRSKNIIVGDL